LAQTQILANQLRIVDLQTKKREITMSEQAKENMTNEENMPNLNVDDNVAGSTHLNEQITQEDDLSKLQNEVNEWKDKYTRLFAEFDNYKKRSFKEKMETIQSAGKEVIVSMLEVLDDTVRAEKQLETTTDVEALKKGVTLVFNKLKYTLHQKGLKAFDSIGEDFNVEKHEAITEIPVDSADKEGKVIDELEKGYLLNDKLIRYAKVVVGKSTLA
jgi:molecular chaperone GrpE